MRYIIFKHKDYSPYKIVREDYENYYIDTSNGRNWPSLVSKKVCNIKEIKVIDE